MYIEKLPIVNPNYRFIYSFPGIIKDFVWNYLPKDSYQKRAMPLVIAFKQLATLLYGNNDDLEKRKAEFQEYKEGALRASIAKLITLADQIFDEGATRDVFMEFDLEITNFH